MVNYLVQRAPWMPAGYRYRLIKTQCEVSFDGYIVETDVGLAKSFKTEYFQNRKAAQERRKHLVATSDELILSVVDFFYVTNQEVAEWLYDSGQLIGIDNYEAWFETLTRHEQAKHKLAFKEAQVRAIWERVITTTV